MTVARSVFGALWDITLGFFSERQQAAPRHSFGMILETQRFSKRVCGRADGKLRVAARSVREGHLGSALALLSEVEDDLHLHERELVDSFASR